MSQLQTTIEGPNGSQNVSLWWRPASRTWAITRSDTYNRFLAHCVTRKEAMDLYHRQIEIAKAECGLPNIAAILEMG